MVLREMKMPIQSVNPATGIVEKVFEEYTQDQVVKTIDNSREAFQKWRDTNFLTRRKLLKNVAQLLTDKKEYFGKILTLEMGKPISQAVSEVEKCAWVCEYFSKNAEQLLCKEYISTNASQSYICFEPLGIILAIMPWNFPFWQVFRFAAPAIMAGNVCILKHASNVPQCALAIEDIFIKSGFPENVFKTLLIGSDKIQNVIANPDVKAVTLTGSEITGSLVARECGLKLKKTVMELGGSDPFIVFEDANIDETVKIAVKARIINNGQSCIAAKRFIVVEKIYDEFMNKFTGLMKNVIIGDPMNLNTELGPIAREDLLIEIDNQVINSVAKGAEILCGGKRIKRDGYYYAPTILSNLSKGMPAYDDEIFGPIASLIRVKDENEAIKIANDTRFGLGASLWTSDLSKAQNIAGKIEAGSVFINEMVKSDPRLPFGGIKNSGYGRELAIYGIKEFVNIKSIWIK
jgi:succinate-semialdehyde dehydrogenase/glutarate-semialdehyde dehydrogenase